MEYVASPGMLATVVATDGFRELKASCPSLLAEVLEKLGSYPGCLELFDEDDDDVLSSEQ
jgi:hypothetical protein|uniref:BPM/SPOP BACK domain-containing protein n=1 Tax=Oryza rufipogon TaxID=4529 RepID=A0A0E0QIT7_ORYRU